jgi:predicted nuclease of predicted toxin-antitoxin system
MRFLADESVEAVVVATLRGAGYEVTYVSEDFPGARDERVLHRALAKRSVLITNDKDFAALAFSQRMASAGIVLMRMPRLRSS